MAFKVAGMGIDFSVAALNLNTQTELKWGSIKTAWQKWCKPIFNLTISTSKIESMVLWRFRLIYQSVRKLTAALVIPLNQRCILQWLEFTHSDHYNKGKSMKFLWTFILACCQDYSGSRFSKLVWNFLDSVPGRDSCPQSNGNGRMDAALGTRSITFDCVTASFLGSMMGKASPTHPSTPIRS